MLIKEREFYSPLVHAIVGIDEAGRGLFLLLPFYLTHLIKTRKLTILRN